MRHANFACFTDDLWNVFGFFDCRRDQLFKLRACEKVVVAKCTPSDIPAKSSPTVIRHETVIVWSCKEIRTAKTGVEGIDGNAHVTGTLPQSNDIVVDAGVVSNMFVER